MRKDPTPEQKKMIERALKETLSAIEDAAETSFEGTGVKSVVLVTALQHWRRRYAPMFEHAVVDLERNWDDDKKLVLNRAEQVGVVAANLATVRSIVLAWIRGEIGKPGQHVHVGSATKPEITIGIAELAARCIDCKSSADDQPGIRWDWCSTLLAPPLPGVRRVSTPPTIRELIEYLLHDAVDSQVEIGEELVKMMENVVRPPG